MKKILLTALILPGLAMGTTVEELDKKFNLLASEMQKMKESKSVSKFDKFSLGGYGEIVYNNKRSEDQSGDSVSGGEATVDTLRHVIVMGYQFDEKWKLVSEVEIEHANKIYAEFLYLDYTHNQYLNFQAGLLPVPVGIINLVHEPPTFYSVNRPEVENKMIPTTWRENGAGVYGRAGDIRYGAYFINSLKGSSFSADSVRGGRQKGSSAMADDQSVVATLNWSGVKGLNVGGSAYVGEVNDGSNARHNIYELHGEWKYEGLRVRGLYAQSFIDAKTLNEHNGLTGSDSIGERQEGGYLEAGYDLLNTREDALILFSRYEILNTQKEVPTGYEKDGANDKTNITIGVNYRPMDQIVFKADYIFARNEAKTGADSFNMGMGWSF